MAKPLSAGYAPCYTARKCRGIVYQTQQRVLCQPDPHTPPELNPEELPPNLQDLKDFVITFLCQITHCIFTSYVVGAITGQSI